MMHEVFPLIGFDNVCFGDNKEIVRKAIYDKFRLKPKEFLKGYPPQSTDAFDCFHVYYDSSGTCEAVEFFGDAHVMIKDSLVFPCDCSSLLSVIPDLKKDNAGWVSVDKSVGVYAPNETIESILFAKPRYYSN